MPYRNLTSQIVSKKEIEEEILERGKKKRTDKKGNGRQYLGKKRRFRWFSEGTFAQQLTSRLAKRIVESDESANASKILEAQEKVDSQKSESAGDENAASPEPKTSLDNIDLLAILEGKSSLLLVGFFDVKNFLQVTEIRTQQRLFRIQ